MTFEEWLNNSEMVKQIDAQSPTGIGVLKLMKSTWQACESGLAERERKEINDWITARAQAEGITIATQFILVEERINIFLTMLMAKFDHEASERVRAAVAEMREKAANIVFTESFRMGRFTLPTEAKKAILALPLDPDPHWLEKKLLEARELEARWGHEPTELHRRGFPQCMWCKRIDALAAERRALEGK